MSVTIREYNEQDLPVMTAIWNEVVDEGMAFPQTEPMTIEQAKEFFAEQDFTAVSQDENGRVTGLYILHPNNIGRCGHIANASYAVASSLRGKGTGRFLVEHSLKKAAELGFGIMQFNAVVANNERALKLYESIGFVKLGRIPQGFRLKNGVYEDIILFYYPLDKLK